MAVNDMVDREERPAYVQFERRAIFDKLATKEANDGIQRYKDIDFALITPPYSKDLVEIKVESWLVNTRAYVKSGKTPQHWLSHWEKQYEAFKEGEELPPDGTPIKTWSAATKAEIKNVIGVGILTVEDLASANDQGIARLGMGAVNLRNKAKSWLQAASDHGPLVQKVTQLERENESLKNTNLKNKATIEALAAQIDAMQNVNGVITPVSAPDYVEPEDISVSDILPEVKTKKKSNGATKPH